MHKISRGFTIVELIIVIVVIGILSTITIVSYNSISARAKDAKIESNMDAINKGVRIYDTMNDSLIPKNTAYSADELLGEYNLRPLSSEIFIQYYPNSSCSTSVSTTCADLNTMPKDKAYMSILRGSNYSMVDIYGWNSSKKVYKVIRLESVDSHSNNYYEYEIPDCELTPNDPWCNQAT